MKAINIGIVSASRSLRFAINLLLRQEAEGTIQCVYERCSAVADGLVPDAAVFPDLVIVDTADAKDSIIKQVEQVQKAFAKSKILLLIDPAAGLKKGVLAATGAVAVVARNCEASRLVEVITKAVRIKKADSRAK